MNGEYRDAFWDLGVPDASSRTQSIRLLLAEAGLDDAAEVLAPALLELRALGTGTPPTPSGALAALLEAEDAGSSADRHAVSLERGRVCGGGPTRRPHRRRRRSGLIALAVAACLGLAGGGAAAADEGFRHAAGDAAAFIIGTLTGARPDRHPALPPTAPASTHALDRDQRPGMPSGQTVPDSHEAERGAAPSAEHPAPPVPEAPRSGTPTAPAAAVPTVPPASRRP